MKNEKIVIVFFFLVMFACCKHDNDCHRNKYILAGEKGECFIYRDFVPDIEVKADSILGSIDTLSIDLNNNQIYDITLRSVDSSKAQILPLSSVRMNGDFRFISSNWIGYITKFNVSEKIENQNWSPQNPLYLFPLLDNTWHNSDHQYMGVCFVNGKDSVLGWVCLSLKGRSHIILHDCGYQK